MVRPAKNVFIASASAYPTTGFDMRTTAGDPLWITASSLRKTRSASSRSDVSGPEQPEASSLADDGVRLGARRSPASCSRGSSWPLLGWLRAAASLRSALLPVPLGRFDDDQGHCDRPRIHRIGRTVGNGDGADFLDRRASRQRERVRHPRASWKSVGQCGFGCTCMMSLT